MNQAALMRVIAVLPDYIPSTIINVITPLRHLHNQGQISFEAYLEDEVYPRQIAAADVIVACRNMEPIYKPIFELALRLGIPIIYDLDDNLFEVPPEIDVGHYHSRPDRREHLAWMLGHVQRVRVHSPVLKQVVEAYNPEVSFVWSAVDWSIVPPELPALNPPPFQIVYATSRAYHDNLFKQVLPDITAILDQYGSRVRLHLLGYQPKELKHYPQVIYKPYETEYERYFRAFTREGYAIGLAPMLTDTFHQCKTDLKFRDYAAAGAVGIYQDCPLYSSVVGQGETGVLVSGEGQSWRVAISHFIENPAALEPIRQRARAVAAARYNMDTVVGMWLDDLRALPPRPPEKRDETPNFERWWFTRAPWMRSKSMRPFRKAYHALVPTRVRLGARDLRHMLRRKQLKQDA